jgi:hypothetical protein
MELVHWWVCVLVALCSQAVLPDSWLVGHLARGEVPDLLQVLINRSVILDG